MQHDEVADVPGVYALFYVCSPKAHDPLEGKAEDACTVNLLDHSVGFFDGHGHRLAKHDVLARASGLDRQLRDSSNRRCDVDDVHVLLFQQLPVVRVAFDTTAGDELVELLLVVPRIGIELRVRILRQRSSETIRRIPMPQSVHCHSPPARPCR